MSKPEEDWDAESAEDHSIKIHIPLKWISVTQRNLYNP